MAGVRASERTHLDAAQTRAVLVGVGTQRPGSGIAAVTQARRTVTDLAAALARGIGLDGARVRLVTDPASPAEVTEALSAAAAEASDLLVFWYVGAILRGAHGEISLSTAGTEGSGDRLADTGLGFLEVMAIAASSRARRVALVIDAYEAAGPQAAARPIGGAAGPAGRIDVLVCGAGDLAALASPGAERTALTGLLVSLLVDGDPDGPPELTLEDLYRRTRLRLAQAPPPRRISSNWANHLVVAPNQAHTSPGPEIPSEGGSGGQPAAAPTGAAALGTRATATADEAGDGGGGTSGEGDDDDDVATRRVEPPVVARQVCPYPGLTSFDAASAQWFFGRERAVEDLLGRLEARLGASGPLVVVGASGAGKSSLLRAGLVPALAAGRIPGSAHWPRVVMTPTAQPLRELAARLAQATTVPVVAATQLEALTGDPDRFGAALAELVALRTDDADDPRRQVLLVVDQFEELFTLSDEADRGVFVRCLRAITTPRADGPAPAVVVLGVRADFYGHCAAFPELLDALQSGQVVVGTMTADEVRTAIVRPAELVGLTCEPGLVDLLLHGLGAAGDGTVVADPGALPLLAHALLTTWQQREGRALTVAGHLRGGGLVGAIATTAEAAYAELDPTAQAAARELLMRLVRIGEGTDDTRRRMRREDLLDELSDTGAGSRVLDAFTSARLITTDADSVQLAHEALLRSWPRLRQWIEFDRIGALTRQELTEAAGRWDNGGRDPSYLLSGTRLSTAREWADVGDHRAGLSGTAAAFLDASLEREQAAARAARRRTRRLQQLVAGLTVLVLFAVASTVFALHQRSTAVHQRALALSRQVANQAATLRSSDPLLAAQLSLVAYRYADTTAARGAVINSLSSGYGFATRRLTGHWAAVTTTAYSPDGHILATGGNDWTTDLWDARNPARATPIGRLTGHRLAVKAVAFSPDGHLIATGSDDRSVRLYDITNPAKPVFLAALPTLASTSVFGLVFSPDGRTLAAGGYASDVRLWNVSDPRRPVAGADLVGHRDEVRTLAYNPAGTIIVTGSEDGTARLWDMTDPARPRELSQLSGQVDADVLLDPSNEVRSVAFSPDGRSVATGSVDTSARVFTVTDPAHPKQVYLDDQTTAISAVTFSPDGQVLAEATSSYVKLANPWHNDDALEILPHPAKVLGIAFSPDGRTLATGAADASVRQWSALDYTIVGHVKFIWNALVAPNGRFLATGDYDNTAMIWDLANPVRPKALQTLTGHEGAIGGLALTGDSRTLATSGQDGRIMLWDTSDPKHVTRLATMAEAQYTVGELAFSPDHSTLYSAVGDGELAVWDVRDPRHPRALTRVNAHRFGLTAVAVSPDGRTLATGGPDHQLRLWDVRTPAHPTPLATIGGFSATVNSIRFSPDGATMAVGTESQVRTWDVHDLRKPVAARTYVGATDVVNAVTYTPDGHGLTAAVGDGTVVTWEVNRPAASPIRLDGRRNGVVAVSYTPDGRYLIGGPNQVVGFVWDTDPEQVITQICAGMGDPITKAEWARYLPDLPYRPPCR
ncbi:WD-40 repeat-containing protein [Frankia sp. AiPs1]|uniref:nSTAND1 domain-containing NTPase n=1 Tax=Frankia sp. AiPa1 TaxID=573492 RepID=UPI00202ADAB9|nr:AAA family ATPase [Frankia sp. AiPa1]MCL9760911.1 AAA family ATPase [Frankia sp. AiPa1]